MTMNTPFYARLTAAVSRQIVLISALLISMPAEVQLARASGFSGGYELLMPLVLSLYSAASAVIAANRPRGTKGRTSAIVGSGVALGMALSAQVVGHLITSGYMTSGPWLVAAVSSVPALAAAHMLHLAHGAKAPVPVTSENLGQDIENKSEDDKGTRSVSTPDNAIPVPVRPKPIGRPKPSIQAIREAADTLDKTGQKVTSSALAAWFNVSDRTGARYKGMLVA
ncbi:hypothetical protein OG936_01035 [Streptomyces sp. NBC_00846]|uniref:hypothetical protein n=1 Tax=Streptomyces sp. NBC_00846 TaxID=2975849 RepID=UPI00386884F9|nr:hypothetical protein OG936_01035 [Streptomyces sp. NBC_00846]